jgi:hypothetical protein
MRFAARRRGFWNYGPLVPLLVFFGLFFFVFVVLIVVEVEVVVLFVVVVRGLQVHRVHTSNGERSATLIAGKQVAFVEIFFVYIDGSVTFRAADHVLFLSNHNAG